MATVDTSNLSVLSLLMKMSKSYVGCLFANCPSSQASSPQRVLDDGTQYLDVPLIHCVLSQLEGRMLFLVIFWSSCLSCS